MESHCSINKMNDDDVESEQEDELAYDMFVDDIKELREVVVQSMHSVLMG